MSLASGIASDLSTTLKLRPTTGIQVEVTSATSGNLLINFDQTGLVRPLKNLSFPISIATTVVGANRQIVGCQNAAGSGGGSCPADQLVTGINPDGTPICTSQGSQLGAPCTVPTGFFDDNNPYQPLVVRGTTSYVANSQQRCCMGGWIYAAGVAGAGCVPF